eukprot:scaffold163340_cov55-Attheya_sp.AAC.2
MVYRLKHCFARLPMFRRKIVVCHYAILTRYPTYRAKNHLQDQRTSGDNQRTLYLIVLDNKKARLPVFSNPTETGSIAGLEIILL